MTWDPSLVQVVPSGSTTFASATSNSDGVISYAVTNPGTTGCSVVSGIRTLSFTAEGTCDVVATVSATGTFDSTSSTATFIITKAAPSVTWTPVTSFTLPGATVTPAAAMTTSDGVVTYSVSADTGTNCSVDPVTGSLSYSAIGQCQITATSTTTTRYSAGSITVTFTVTEPTIGGGSGGGGASGLNEEGGVSRPNPLAQAPDSSAGQNDSIDQMTQPGAANSTRGRTLPPRPRDVQVTRIPGGSRSTVRIKQPEGAAGSEVLATVVVVRDRRGAIVSRISISLEPGQNQATVTVPFVAEGFSVNVYNVNEVGVSAGALSKSPLVRATTITARTGAGRPTLFGALMGKPIIFDGGSATLDAMDRAQLRSIAQAAQVSHQRIFVTGFARKGAGPTDELAALSTRRAKAAAMFLVAQGVRVWTRYWGAGSLNGSGSAGDRRVEVRTSALPIPRSLVP
jgi:outer membrane protein OmpA-like peptidoglycan-associated protein